MKIIVQKFGGTSVQSVEDRQKAALHVKKAVEEGYKVVVVVSAMGRKGAPYATDTLLSLVENKHLSNREMDLLMSCGETISSVVFSSLLQENHIQSEAMTGGQAGFRTSENFTNAKIIEVKTEHIRERLKMVDVVVVAGFQGQTKTGEITTIGRGGSDTSAAALGAALGAEWIDIFTDVEGIMTADPRIVSEARHLDVLTYNEVCNMAYQGAKVIHPRAVEIAMHAKVPIRIRSTQSDRPGTLITALKKVSKGQDIQERLITGITYMDEITQIKVKAKKDEYDFQSKIFKAMAEQQISVDFFNISPQEVVYTVNKSTTDRAIAALEVIGYHPEVKRDCAKVSTVGAGIAGVPGVTSKIVHALTSQGIQILQSADSHTTIWVLIENKYLHEAVNGLHRAFELDKENQKSSGISEYY
ncbi:aspartate kinase [Pullulanibacillus pueri]|uniref:Aspartokinase n=1 Tax=Pullulanibacillus pueri TaxID=1437324 RepID=A0A8J2ZVY6_9BACL|nr:aspartate kinase [Pullulanibacillus pueri]MBM7682530.1 aspartate kinase [Pullulanibacillus pueri]GGH82033.1 aspartokinase [Pullulanibacillus pueri]